MVTLFHSGIPIWLADRGGVLAPDFDKRFAEYALETVKRLSTGPASVHYWLTVNEPVTYAETAYIDGTRYYKAHMAPLKFLHAIQSQVRAHLLAVAAIRGLQDPLIQVGVASDWDDFQISGRSLLSKLVRFFSNQVYNRYFLDGIIYGHSSLCMPGDLFCEHYKLPDGKPGVDFVGINYYSEELIKSGWKPPFVTMGNDLYAHGIEDALVGASRYGLPVMITENGVPDSTDQIRPDFIKEHIAALDQARSVLKVPVLGYLHWSLTDNFEWSSGLSVRYGLIEMDYKTLARIPRGSYTVYRDIIADHLRTQSE